MMHIINHKNICFIYMMCPYEAPLPPGYMEEFQFNQNTTCGYRTDYTTGHYQFSEDYYPTVMIKDFGTHGSRSLRDRCQNQDKNNHYPEQKSSS